MKWVDIQSRLPMGREITGGSWLPRIICIAWYIPHLLVHSNINFFQQREIKEALALEHHVSKITKNSDDPGVRPPHIGMYRLKFRRVDSDITPALDHCIESLRQYIMCKADATMLTWYWPDEEPQPGTKYHPRTNYTFQQQCMNWPKLQDWAISNSFQLSPETIFHPKYGKNAEIPWFNLQVSDLKS